MSEFDKVIGYESIIFELERFCDVLKKPEKYNRLGVSVPSGILLWGNPGVGKTLMANCFIAESGYKSFTLRKEKPNGEFVKEIKNTYEKAYKVNPAIVFLDDMDKFANEDEHHCNSEEYVTVQSCIDEYNKKGVFTIATVNNKFCLPESLIRSGRFDKIIEISQPAGVDAHKLIEHFLNGKNIIKSIDAEELSILMEGYSSASLESIINEAGIYAGFENRIKINHNDLLKAYLRVVFDTPERVDSIPEELLERIAVHETGHTIVAEMLVPGSVNMVTVCSYSCNGEGVTKVKWPEGHNLSKLLSEFEVICMLGGKAATEVFYGDDDMGCNLDMHNAFAAVTEFVDNVCSDGFDTFTRNDSSQYLLEKRDVMIASEVNKYYKMAKRVIIENRSFFDAVLNALIKQRILTYKNIKDIREWVGYDK